MTIFENKEPNIYSILGNVSLNSNNVNYSIVKLYKFSDTTSNYINSKKALQSLQMVLLDASYLDKKSSELSLNEIKKINLAKALCENKSHLVLDYFDKELNYKEKIYFKNLFKRLVNDYHKTIILHTNDLSFIWDISQEIYVIDDDIKVFNKNDLSILNYVEKPEIIKFIDLLKAKNIDIDYYKEPQDLLKAIYRIKE